jgi:DNA-binding winged helix-turn-helix (wHTH) protein
MRVALGPCIFDSETREVTRSGKRIDLDPKAFQLLGALIESRPRALSREQLKDLLWPRTFVAHTSLPRVVSELRRALGDDRREPRYVRTVHGFGYAFCGEAATLSGGVEARAGAGFPCMLVWGDRRIGLVEGENWIGRDADCTVRIDAPIISRHHARIVVSGGSACLEDLGSKNGTHLRGQRLLEPVILADGDELVIGQVVLIFRAGFGLEATRTDREHRKRPRRSRGPTQRLETVRPRNALTSARKRT